MDKTSDHSLSSRKSIHYHLESGEKGGSHTKRSPVYSDKCLDCGKDNITAG